MSRLLDTFVTDNPLLAHGPRTHATGVQLPQTAARPARRRRVWAPVDAPRVHLGHAGRT
jgi:hypothetical protein